MGELYVANENAFVAAAECYRLAACTLRIRASGIVSICNRKSQTYNRKPTARVAELADAPDYDCEIIDFRASLLVSKQSHFTIGKPDFGEILQSTNTEQKTHHSSTNSSTRTHQSHARVRLTIDVRAMFVLP